MLLREAEINSCIIVVNIINRLLSHLILSIALCGRYKHYPQVTDEETELW